MTSLPTTILHPSFTMNLNNNLPTFKTLISSTDSLLRQTVQQVLLDGALTWFGQLQKSPDRVITWKDFKLRFYERNHTSAKIQSLRTELRLLFRSDDEYTLDYFERLKMLMPEIDPECDVGINLPIRDIVRKSQNIESTQVELTPSDPMGMRRKSSESLKFLLIITDNISNEKFLYSSISAENVIISANSFDVTGSAQEIDVPSSNIDTDIGAVNILGVIPAEKVPMFSTEQSSIVIHKVLQNHLKVNIGSSKKNLKSSKRSKIYPLQCGTDIGYGSKLYISNRYQLDIISNILRTSVLCRYIRNRVKHSVWKTMVYKKR
ncbi:unnamed protein product [Rotaria magnacalcarata]|uniref:Retrotransposon gag domain-containing protein n=2 Tax=Rotaria magnacalcarata TaxID=392030 RepID=A0A820F6Q6_9BILA|nr:unnamed protein product [Rotaria magnacalcarata]